MMGKENQENHMSFDHDLDLDAARLECDAEGCNAQAVYEGDERMCRGLARSDGWRFVSTPDGYRLTCPSCAEYVE